MKHADVKKDANNRAARTFLEGLAVTCLFTVALVVNTVLTSTDYDKIFRLETWVLILCMVVKDVLVAATAYILRRSEG